MTNKTEIGINQVLVFPAEEAAKVLGYKDTYGAVHIHCKDLLVDKATGEFLIEEPDLERLINSSSLTVAQKEEWYTLFNLKSIKHEEEENPMETTKFTNEALGVDLTIIKHENGDLLFPAVAVAEMLGYKNPHDALKKHCKKTIRLSYREMRKIETTEINGINGLSETHGIILIKELDLGRLITKSALLTAAQKEEWYTAFNISFTALERPEICFFKELREALQPWGYTLKQQVTCDKYKLDAVIPELNIIIEYDENGHKGYCPKAEKVREQVILNSGYSKIIRVLDIASHSHNIGKVLFNLVRKGD